MSRTLPARLEWLGRLALALLAFSLPYELIVFSAGPLQVSSLEFLLALLVLCVVALVLIEKRWRRAGWLRVPRTWLVLWALLFLALLLSTLLAPEFRLNAAKASARLVAGMALALAVPQLVRREQVRWVIIPLLLGGTLAALAGLWEVWRGDGLSWLAPFRVTPTRVGPFIRLTGPFDHANQAAMFLEATAPLLLAALLVAYRRRAWQGLAVALVVVLWLQAIVSTYSRTAIVAVVASCLLVAALLASNRFLSGARRSRPGAPSSRPWVALSLALIVLVAANAFVDPVVRMRFRTEGDNEWYNLSFVAPQTLDVEAGHIITTTVTVHNEGDLVWSSDPPTVINLGGHWYLPGEDTSLAYRPRWPLPHPVAPGESVTMQVGLRAPLHEGAYQFRWDVIHEGSTWFSYKNGVRTRTLVNVNEASTPAPPPPPATEAALNQVIEAPPDLAPVPDRRTLWRIAAEEFSQRPLLGIGMDNYRLVYGRALDYEQWNDTIHTNNWYIEMLVSLGLVGALPFFGWLALALFSMLRSLRLPRATVWHAALAAGFLAFLLHGLLDYFLAANATAMLFWFFSALWVSIDNETPRGV